MGKKIDRFAAAVLLTGLTFVVFIRISGNIPAACIFSFVAAALFRLVLRKTSNRKKISKSAARRILNSWAWESEKSARDKITALLRPSETDLPITCILRPQGFSISKSDIFTQWKAHTGQPRLIIAGTCPADGNAISFAEPLKNPSILLLDANKLIPRIRKSGMYPQEVHSIPETIRLMRVAIANLPAKCPWTRSALTGLIAFSLYMLHGNPLSLLLALCMLFLSGISYRARKT